MTKPHHMFPEEAAFRGLLTADEYLDLYGVPRRPWPERKQNAGDYCQFCDQFFADTNTRNRHVQRLHREEV